MEQKIENKWARMPSNNVQATANEVKNRGINVVVVENKDEALEKIKGLIPRGGEVMTGSSTTLQEIGFSNYLNEGQHGWKNLGDEIQKEGDEAKRADLRRRASSAEYFLASVNAISKNGELVASDASGSRVTAFPFAAKNLILIAGAQKITDSLEEAMQRVREYVYPLENERAMKAYGMSSTIGKWIIIEREIFQNRTTLILVKEKLGF